mmetsp:Transcript_79844/g.172572  ORF Transcript_79844/g.172572 Transcript_79844/m.172572 type:complete len:220 (+) Transcript_79844:212-871(+)
MPNINLPTITHQGHHGSQYVLEQAHKIGKELSDSNQVQKTYSYIEHKNETFELRKLQNLIESENKRLHSNQSASRYKHAASNKKIQLKQHSKAKKIVDEVSKAVRRLHERISENAEIEKRLKQRDMVSEMNMRESLQKENQALAEEKKLHRGHYNRLSKMVNRDQRFKVKRVSYSLSKHQKEIDQVVDNIDIYRDTDMKATDKKNYKKKLRRHRNHKMF